MRILKIFLYRLAVKFPMLKTTPCMQQTEEDQCLMWDSSIFLHIAVLTFSLKIKNDKKIFLKELCNSKPEIYASTNDNDNCKTQYSHASNFH